MKRVAKILIFILTMLPPIAHAESDGVTAKVHEMGQSLWSKSSRIDSLRATPYIYFGEVKLHEKSCDDWMAEFYQRFDGIDQKRVASFAVTNCYDIPDNRRLVYEGLIEPWQDDDIDYLKQFIAKRQGFPVLDHQLTFLAAQGVVFDLEVKYFDKESRIISPIGNQTLTLGSVNVHLVDFDFEAARDAMGGSVGEGFLPFLEKTFGKEERLLAENFYLMHADAVCLHSHLRFLLDDFHAYKMRYWRSCLNVSR